jgi:ParB family chromosome partitioning protein
MEKHGWTQERLAEAIGKNRRTINEVLKLNTLPNDIKEECRALGTEVSKIALLQIARIDDPPKQRDFWVQVKGGNLSTREIQAQRKTSATPKATPSPLRQAVSKGKGFVYKLRELSPEDIGDEEYYELLEVIEEITKLLETMNMQRRR